MRAEKGNKKNNLDRCNIGNLAVPGRRCWSLSPDLAITSSKSTRVSLPGTWFLHLQKKSEYESPRTVRGTERTGLKSTDEVDVEVQADQICVIDGIASDVDGEFGWNCRVSSSIA